MLRGQAAKSFGIQFAAMVVLLAMMCPLAGCGSSAPPAPATYTTGPTTHVVRRGETLYRIARQYGVSASALMRSNALANPYQLRTGQLLIIPGRRSTAVGRNDSMPLGVTRPPAPPHSFSWPVAGGAVSSGFGIRHGVMHDGIDIAAPTGTPVHAADSGTVIYSGRLRGYGNVIIIQHDGRFVTVYGHQYLTAVRVGEHVARGQLIGEVGSSGRTTGPNLHFEVRHDNLAYNPLGFLPAEAPTVPTFARGDGS